MGTGRSSVRTPLYGCDASGARTVDPMKRDFTVIIERDADGWYVAGVPALPAVISRRSLDEVTERVREVIELCLEDSHR